MPATPDAVMLFAAGFGTRMKPLTNTCPKPLINVGGQTLLDRTLDLARAVDPTTIVANSHYLGEMLAAYLRGSDITLSHETPEILDTGGGLRAALPLLGTSPVYTSNTDAVWHGPNPFAMLRDLWRPQDMDALLMCVPCENTRAHSGSGDFTMDSEGRLRRGGGLIYGGVQIIKTDRLSEIDGHAFSLNSLWNLLGERDRLFGARYTGMWCDVGSISGIAHAEEMLEGRDV